MTGTTPLDELVIVTPGEGLDVRLARMEHKLDLAVARLTPKLDAHGKELADHEARLRQLEARQTVTPLGLWTVVVGVVGVAGGLLLVIERFVTITTN